MNCLLMYTIIMRLWDAVIMVYLMLREGSVSFVFAACTLRCAAGIAQSV